MKNLKKIWVLLIAIVMMASLSACGTDKNETKEKQERIFSLLQIV